MRQILQPFSFTLLTFPNGEQHVFELDIRDNYVPVNPQEHGEQSLDGFEIAM